MAVSVGDLLIAIEAIITLSYICGRVRKPFK